MDILTSFVFFFFYAMLKSLSNLFYFVISCPSFLDFSSVFIFIFIFILYLIFHELELLSPLFKYFVLTGPFFAPSCISLFLPFFFTIRGLKPFVFFASHLVVRRFEDTYFSLHIFIYFYLLIPVYLLLSLIFFPFTCGFYDFLRICLRKVYSLLYKVYRDTILLVLVFAIVFFFLFVSLF